MSQQLFILFRDASPESIEWLIYKNKQLVEPETQDQLELVKQVKKASSIVVLLPAEEFAFYQINLPAKNDHALTKAIPFALEERVIEPIDQLFFAIFQAPKDKSDKRKVWVCNNAKLDRYLGILKDLGIKANHIAPESSLIQNFDTECFLCVENNRMIMRYKDSIAVSPPEQSLVLLEQQFLLQEEDDVISCDMANFSALPASVRQAFENSESVKVLSEEYEASQYLQFLANRFLAKTPVNLLQGKYKEQVDVRHTLKRWWFALLMLVAITVLVLGTVFIENRKLSANIKQLDQQINQQYLETFPNISSLPIAKAKFQQIVQTTDLDKLSGEGGIAIALFDLGEILRAHPEISIKGIDYKPPYLTFNLQSKTLDQMEKVFGLLSKGKYQAKVVSITNKNDVVVGIMKIPLNQAGGK